MVPQMEDSRILDSPFYCCLNIHGFNKKSSARPKKFRIPEKAPEFFRSRRSVRFSFPFALPASAQPIRTMRRCARCSITSSCSGAPSTTSDAGRTRPRLRLGRRRRRLSGDHSLCGSLLLLSPARAEFARSAGPEDLDGSGLERFVVKPD